MRYLGYYLIGPDCLRLMGVEAESMEEAIAKFESPGMPNAVLTYVIPDVGVWVRRLPK